MANGIFGRRSSLLPIVMTTSNPLRIQFGCVRAQTWVLGWELSTNFD